MNAYVAVIWREYPAVPTGDGDTRTTYDGESTPIGPNERYKTAAAVMQGYRQRYSEGARKFETEEEFLIAYGGPPLYAGTHSSLEESDSVIREVCEKLANGEE